MRNLLAIMRKQTHQVVLPEFSHFHVLSSSIRIFVVQKGKTSFYLFIYETKLQSCTDSLTQIHIHGEYSQEGKNRWIQTDFLSSPCSSNPHHFKEWVVLGNWLHGLWCTLLLRMLICCLLYCRYSTHRAVSSPEQRPAESPPQWNPCKRAVDLRRISDIF